jgi:hypothetical protein
MIGFLMGGHQFCRILYVSEGSFRRDEMAYETVGRGVTRSVVGVEKRWTPC